MLSTFSYIKLENAQVSITLPGYRMGYIYLAYVTVQKCAGVAFLSSFSFLKGRALETNAFEPGFFTSCSRVYNNSIQNTMLRTEQVALVQTASTPGVQRKNLFVNTI